MFGEVLILCATSVFLCVSVVSLFRSNTNHRDTEKHRGCTESVYRRLAVPCERRKINALTGNHKFPLTNPSGYGTAIV